MQPRTPVYLEHIRDAAQFVIDLTSAVTFEQYLANRGMRQAVERNFEIIGEAMRRLEHHDPVTAAGFPEAKELICFRNALIHGYDGIDHARLWRTITIFLPPLLVRVEGLIEAIDAVGV